MEIPCPHCGGQTPWSLLQTLNQCRFCGSILSWPYPEGEPDYLVADSVVEQPEDLIDVLATYDAMRESSLRRGRLKSGDPDRPELLYDLGGGFANVDMYEMKRKRIHLFKVLKSFCLFVPYQMVTSMISFHVLGRVSGDHKRFQSMFFTAEDIVPGYPPDWNFRDRGLQVSKSTLRPLASNVSKGKFLATATVTGELEKLTRQYTNQRKILESEIQPICFHGSVFDVHRWWVYRPFYFVNASTPQGAQWFLVDGQFGTIAGTPSAAEVDKLTRGQWQKLDLHKIRSCNIKAIPFRCPNCGWDVTLRSGIYQLCDNCTRLLEPYEGGLKIVSYRTMPPDQFSWWPRSHRGPKVWLPFWRFQLSVNLDRKEYHDLSLLFKDLLPAAAKLFRPRQDYCIPAFDCWPVAKYDEWAFGFGARMSEETLLPSDAVLHENWAKKEEVLLPAISPKLIPDLFPRILPLFLPTTAHARLNMMVLNRLAQAVIQIHNLELIYSPCPLFESKGSEPKLHGPSGQIEWTPIRERKWPPILQRSVKRWKSLSDGMEKESIPKSRSKWLTSPFNR